MIYLYGAEASIVFEVEADTEDEAERKATHFVRNNVAVAFQLKGAEDEMLDKTGLLEGGDLIAYFNDPVPMRPVELELWDSYDKVT